jgi:hypothetical protein
MSQVITFAELESLSDCELHAKYQAILDDLARAGQRLEDCPHIQASMRNIEEVLRRRQYRAPKAPKPKPPGL